MNLNERVARVETLIEERSDQQDEILTRIERKVDSLAPRLAHVERKQAYAAAWLAGAIAMGTAVGGFVAWLISMAGK